jgi:peptidoglycan/xylan/chitin deacetylase (PgdA/CDA1 family)
MKKYGFDPVSFAYPSGSRNAELDKELVKHFNILRGTTYYPMPQFHTSPMVNGLGIDENYSPVDFILGELEKDHDKGQFVVLYGHTPILAYENIPKYHTSVRRLVQIIKKARGLGYHFCTISELFPKTNVIVNK